MAMTPTDARAAHDGELVDELDRQVRGLVRSEGVDPQRDAGLVRRIVEGVVRDHDERSLTGMVAPVGDVESWSASRWPGWPGSGRCSRSSTTPGTELADRMGYWSSPDRMGY